jgi:voltage-gated potassium channel Kch
MSARDDHHIIIDADNAAVPASEAKPLIDEVYLFIRQYHVALKLIIFIIYNAVAASFYVKNEGWTPIDSVYFVTVTTTTVGYGYLHPSTDESRVFTIFLILLGTTFVIYTVNEFAKAVLLGAQEELLYFLLGYMNIKRSDVKAKDLRLYKTCSSLLGIIWISIVGTLYMMNNEGWTYLRTVYWLVVTMTTTGYGDITPLKEKSRLFGIFFLYSVVVIFAVSFNNIWDQWREASDAHIEKYDKNCTKWIDKVQSNLPKLMKRYPDGITTDKLMLEILTAKNIICYKDDVLPLLNSTRGAFAHSDKITMEEIESFLQTCGNNDMVRSPLHD